MTKSVPSDPPHAIQWALNLGATPAEAQEFANLKGPGQIWDYILGVMNKAGFRKFQPWIGRDVERLLKTFDLPLDEEYTAIHVRRGDKLAEEARGEVVKYWRSKGHADLNNLPTDNVPFAHYLNQWDGADECNRNDNGEVQWTDHNVYIATDDPVTVRNEIAALPVEHIVSEKGPTILWNGCHQLTFYFNPTDETSAFHLNGTGENSILDDDTCFGRYQRNIMSIADMMILSKAKTFIGETNSNWGRVIRTIRTLVVQADNGGDSEERNGGLLTRTLDTRIAWGATRPRAPGF